MLGHFDDSVWELKLQEMDLWRSMRERRRL